MKDEVFIKPALKSDKELVYELLQEYLQELNTFEVIERENRGAFEYKYFDDYWLDSNRHPFIFYIEEKVVGFAFVRELDSHTFQIAEFHIISEFRTKGIGMLAASRLFRKFTGAWHVAYAERNVPAKKFWRNVINSFTDGNYTEEVSESQPEGTKLIFESTEK